VILSTRAAWQKPLTDKISGSGETRLLISAIFYSGIKRARLIKDSKSILCFGLQQARLQVVQNDGNPSDVKDGC